MNRYFLKLIFTCSLLLALQNSECAGQDFVHDTLFISDADSTLQLFYGLSTPAEVLAFYKDCSIKSKVTKEGKKDERRYTKTQRITLSDKHTHLYFSSTKNSINALDSTLTFSSASLEKGSTYLFNDTDWMQKNRQVLDIELGERVKEKKRNTFYYLDSGITIKYYSKSLISLPKSLTFFESPEVADRNFEIYLDWKSKQEQ